MFRPRSSHLASALAAALCLGALAPCAALAQPAAPVVEAPRETVGTAARVAEQLDAGFRTYVVDALGALLLWDVVFWDEPEGGVAVPFVVAWLLAGGIFFTLRLGFVSLRGFRHGVQVTRGIYDRPGDPGEVSHFQALASALSATVGLGNIAGVAVAVHIGGPGAVFWMMVTAFFGMSSKFTECALAVMYRDVGQDGHVLGGPMRYLPKGLAELGHPRLGRGLAVFFALLCIGGSFGGGNMFQANQSYAQVASLVPALASKGGAFAFGIGLAVLVGLVIVGGVQRIARVASFIVPIMCGIYVLAGIAVLVANADAIVPAFGKILSEAFSMHAGIGALVGTIFVGVQRASFSNEAGIGSAAIAHAAAATDEPIREGFVALLEPFIDTIIVCATTGLVLVVSGAYAEPETNGVALTSHAFATVLPWFPAVLALTVFLFAYSTMISWSYYGERCAVYLFGEGSSRAYRYVFLAAVVLGAVLELETVITFSDLMILGMALPNVLGMALLSGKVRAALDDYLTRLRRGEMVTVRERASAAFAAPEGDPDASGR
jgi:AGCS family alanine or glycine:cation symporter